jgi:hypothetical protein
MYVYVEDESIECESKHSDEDYGDWYSYLRYSIKGVHLHDAKYRERFGCNKVKAGDTVYILVCKYSDGDSFGSSYGNAQILWVFTDKKVAQKAKKVWKKAEKEGPVEFYDGEQKVKLSNPVSDYFCNLDEYEIVEIVVEE